NEVDSHLSVRVPVTAGPHDVIVTFPKEDFAQPEGRRGAAPDLRKPFVKSYVGYGDVNGLPSVHRVFIEGPFEATGPGDTPSRARIFVCHPASAADEAPCARRILATLIRRAYRRPSRDADVADVWRFYEAGRREGGFESGIEMAVRGLL